MFLGEKSLFTWALKSAGIEKKMVKEKMVCSRQENAAVIADYLICVFPSIWKWQCVSTVVSPVDLNVFCSRSLSTVNSTLLWGIQSSGT